MSLHDDYPGDMNGKFSHRDIELVLAGEEPGDGRVALLVPFIEALRSEAGTVPGDAEVSRVAAIAAGIARDELTRPKPGLARRKRWGMGHPLAWRMASAVGAVLLVIGLGSGVAIAADGAAPGDPLYGVDRALERIGIGAGGTTERISEANHLLATGQIAAALNHVADALVETGDGEGIDTRLDDAATALRAAAAAAHEAGSSEEVRAAVADMLEWIARSDPAEPDFGRAVADRARGITDSPATTITTPAGQEPGPPASTPGNPDPGSPDQPPGSPPQGNPDPPEDPPGTAPGPPGTTGPPGSTNPGGGPGNKGDPGNSGSPGGLGNSGPPVTTPGQGSAPVDPGGQGSGNDNGSPPFGGED